MTEDEKRSLATTILTEYAKAVEPLDTVAIRHGIRASTLREWCVTDAEIAAAYTRARSVSAGSLEDAAIEIANASTAATYNADRVKIDTYKWAAAKRHPKEYGDRVQHDTTVTIGTLHLDALRQRTVGATAKISQPDTPHILTPPTPDPSGGDVVPEAD